MKMKKYVEELEKQAILNPVKAKLDAKKSTDRNWCSKQ